MKLLGLLLLMACARGTQYIPPMPAPAHAGDRNAKEVRELRPFSSERAWQASHYWRPEDPFGWPFYAIIAMDDTACALWGNVVYLPTIYDYYVCETSWRIARP